MTRHKDPKSLYSRASGSRSGAEVCERWFTLKFGDSYDFGEPRNPSGP